MPLPIHRFLREHRDEIIATWEEAAAAEERDVYLTGAALRDHLPEFLNELAAWLESAEAPGTPSVRAAAADHAASRLRDSYQLKQLIREFSLLRATILRLLIREEGADKPEVGGEVRAADLARLNAGLDLAITDVVEHFVAGEVAKREQAENATRRGEAALHESEARYRTLFDSIDEGFCVIEVLFEEAGKPVDYRFIEVNPAFEQQTGLVNAVGKRMRELAPSHEEHWFEIYGRVAVTGEPIRFENAAKELGRWYDVYAFRTGVPERRRVAVLFNDITERHRAEVALRHSEAALDAFFANSPGILNLDDEEFRYLKTDALTPTYFGLTRETIIGKSVKELAPEFIAKFEPMMAHVLETGEPRLNVEVSSPVPNRPGEVTYWQASYFAVPLADGKRGLGVIGVDITDLKKAVAALREEDRRKTEFLAVLSHELRNPLAPIRNSLFLLERAPQGSEQAARAREVVRRQTEHLTRLVDDLLDITRISRGKMALQRTCIDLRDIVRKTTDDLLSLFEKAGVELRVDYGTHGPVWIDADPTRVAQTLGNLLQNAVKFTPSGGSVAVRLAAADGRAELCVQDNGVGMDPSSIEQMFKPFAQATQTLARTRGGLGLGLALVKAIVEMHGGSVHAKSEGLGRGSEFRVSIPLVEADAESREGRVDTAAAIGKVIVIVEDNVDAGASLAEILEMYGHRVHLARDARSGLALAREHEPDVILCDIGLPDMDGYELARVLRREEAHRTTRLVALTGYAQPEDRQRARDAGFDAHMSKPPDLEKLMKVLSSDG
jgi:PAS domain S-box-containing protein